MQQNSSYTHKVGLPPGTLIHLGKRMDGQEKLTVIDYNDSNFEAQVCAEAKETFDYKDKDSVSWINLDGLHNTEVIADLGRHFGLHPLLQEDILNTKHRPKAEEVDGNYFLTLKMFGIDGDQRRVVSEQVSFVLGKGWLLSFQEQEGDIFGSIRSRLEEGIGLIRKRKTDYLLYRLLDTVVDNYFFVTDHFGTLIESLEDVVYLKPDKDKLLEIQRIKKDLLVFKKAVTPLREAIGVLIKDSNDLFHPDTLRFLQDVYDHIMHVLDSIETQREAISAVMDLYLNGVSNQMNQVMQVLTIIATIFIPLTFVAGIYGMNFDNMPELHWEYGYHAVWVVMAVLMIVMLVFFKRKRWL